MSTTNSTRLSISVVVFGKTTKGIPISTIKSQNFLCSSIQSFLFSGISLTPSSFNHSVPAWQTMTVEVCMLCDNAPHSGVFSISCTASSPQRCFAYMTGSTAERSEISHSPSGIISAWYCRCRMSFWRSKDKVGESLMSDVLKSISRKTVRASSVTIRGGVLVSGSRAKNRSRA